MAVPFLPQLSSHAHIEVSIPIIVGMGGNEFSAHITISNSRFSEGLVKVAALFQFFILHMLRSDYQ